VTIMSIVFMGAPLWMCSEVQTGCGLGDLPDGFVMGGIVRRGGREVVSSRTVIGRTDRSLRTVPNLGEQRHDTPGKVTLLEHPVAVAEPMIEVGDLCRLAGTRSPFDVELHHRIVVSARASSRREPLRVSCRPGSARGRSLCRRDRHSKA